MPHPSYDSLNDPDLVAARAEQRATDHAGTHASVQVGVPLVRQLLQAYDDMARLRAAGWAVADDGDPYQPA
jgi:hypothetical protein